jgi:hypothetical protein
MLELLFHMVDCQLYMFKDLIMHFFMVGNICV